MARQKPPASAPKPISPSKAEPLSTGKDPTMAILIRALSNVTFDECKGLLEMGDKKQARSFFNEGHG